VALRGPCTSRAGVACAVPLPVSEGSVSLRGPGTSKAGVACAVPLPGSVSLRGPGTPKAGVASEAVATCVGFAVAGAVGCTGVCRPKEGKASNDLGTPWVTMLLSDGKRGPGDGETWPGATPGCSSAGTASCVVAPPSPTTPSATRVDAPGCFRTREARNSDARGETEVGGTVGGVRGSWQTSPRDPAVKLIDRRTHAHAHIHTHTNTDKPETGPGT